MVKFIQSINNENIYWETISPYELLKFLMKSESSYKMSLKEAVRFIGRLMKYLDLDINTDELIKAYKEDKK